jgi:replication factor C subunit 3/5
MLWVDKHRPKNLDDLSYHEETTKRLEALVKHSANMPHLFVYGPSGSGKKTRIMALLQRIYGNGAHKLKLDKRSFTTPSNRVIDINMVSSPHHIELCPGDAGLNDRFVVQEVIKEMASNRALNFKKGTEFKIVILHEADRLSKQAQSGLRRTMEKYAATCRLILVCNSPSKLMEPVRSRCLGIRVPAPTIDEVRKTLDFLTSQASLCF